MIGIYKITNKINNKVYIGQSILIEKRLKEHQLRAFRGDSKTNKEYEKSLYRAFRKYGIDNFLFEVIEECEREDLNKLEGKYIKQYNSHIDGYNETDGGEYLIFGKTGEKHNNAKLTEQDVYYIRECYNNRLEKSVIYELFKDKINKTGFHKVWLNQTWKQIHQDVYTEENRQYYLFQRNSHKGETNGRALFNKEDVIKIRTLKKNGVSRKDVREQYQIGTQSGFDGIWYNRTWKNIVV